MGIDTQILVKTESKITEDQVLGWAYDLASAFGYGNFSITRPDNKWGQEPNHCLKIVERYTQDGPTIEPRGGQIFIEAYLYTRYYGLGYERGNLSLIIGVADWLERTIPGAEIWYGGDSSGVSATLFDAEARESLWQHFVKVGHTPYNDYFDHGDDGVEAPICTLCQRKLRRNGWGRNYAAFYCSGCGLCLMTRDNGESFQDPEEKASQDGQ